MKIAIDARAMNREPSGVGIYTSTLIYGLAELVNDDQYILASNRPIVISQNISKRFSIEDDPFPIGNLWLQTKCAALLKKKRVDVFHGTNFLAPLLSPCPTVLTVHDLSSFLFPQMHTHRNNLVQRLLPAAMRRASRIIAISENTKKDLIKHLNVPEEKIRVVHNAPAPYFKPQDGLPLDVDLLKALGLPERYFLFVGTLEPRKNIVRLLEAFADADRRNDKQTLLVIVGADGWGADEVSQTYRYLNLGDKVRFLGYIPHEKLPSVYRSARALVMPSIYEGFGLPAVEAMACGTPAIVAANSGLAEAVGDSALLIDHRNVQQIADSLLQMDKDEGFRDRYREAALARAKIFSHLAFAKKTREVYLEALENCA